MIAIKNIAIDARPYSAYGTNGLNVVGTRQPKPVAAASEAGSSSQAASAKAEIRKNDPDDDDKADDINNGIHGFLLGDMDAWNAGAS